MDALVIISSFFVSYPILVPGSPSNSCSIAFRRYFLRSLLVGSSLAGWLGAAANETAENPSAGARVLTVSAAADNYPYSYLDQTGKITGFAVDVLDAVAARMNLQLKREIMPAMTDLQRFPAGEFDIGQWHPHIPGPGADAEYSVPIVVVQGAIFVRRGDRRFSTIKDLRTQRARIATPTQGHVYALQQGLDPELIHTASSPECLQLLAAGQVDAVLVTRLTGLAQAQHLGIRNVEPVGASLEGFTVRYCFVTRHGDVALMAQLNEGLAVLYRTDEFERLYQKWFAAYTPVRIAREQVIAYVAGGLALALVIVAWALQRQRQLRSRIARQAEELDESRNLLADAQRFAHLGHWQRYFNQPGNGVWSDETYRIFERNLQLGPPAVDEWIDCAISADRARWCEAMKRLTSEGKAYELDAVIELQPNLQKAVRLLGRPMIDRAGIRIGSFGTVQDVTAWRAAEEALRNSEQHLRALYENLPLAIGVVERNRGDWLVVSLNPAAVRQFGLTGEPHPGQTLGNLGLTPDWVEYWTKLFSRCIEEAQPLKTTLSRDDQNRHFAVTLVPLTQTPERPRCCFLIEDITERKQMDAEIDQGRRLRAIGELVGGIAHEFNNLLTPILMNSDLLQAEWAHVPRLRDDLRMIVDAARRSAELTRRLLAFGRKSEPHPELLDLRTVVETNIELVRHAFDRRIRIETNVPDNLPLLFLNGGDLNQVLLNLLVNARDTLTEKLGRPPDSAWVPCIHVEAALRPIGSIWPFEPNKDPPPTGWIRLTLRDNGCGMPPMVLERIFEPFYTTKQVGQGTGLGLATVWHVGAHLGGRVNVESTLGEGSAFHVLLPVRPPPAAVPAASSAGVAQPATPATPRRLLLVEDEDAVASLMSTLLRRLGHQLTAAKNGQEGWERLSSAPDNFDGVIMDLNMPGLSGLELASRARAFGYAEPMVAVSGRVTDDDRAKLTSLGVKAVVNKPFTLDELRAALALAFAEAPPSAQGNSQR